MPGSGGLDRSTATCWPLIPARPSAVYGHTRVGTDGEKREGQRAGSLHPRRTPCDTAEGWHFPAPGDSHSLTIDRFTTFPAACHAGPHASELAAPKHTPASGLEVHRFVKKTKCLWTACAWASLAGTSSVNAQRKSNEGDAQRVTIRTATRSQQPHTFCRPVPRDSGPRHLSARHSWQLPSIG